MWPDQLSDSEMHFSTVTTENAFQWGEMSPVEGTVHFSVTDRLVGRARQRGLRVRAHNLFWHRLQLPAWVRPSVELARDPGAWMRELMLVRIEAVVGHSSHY